MEPAEFRVRLDSWGISLNALCRYCGIAPRNGRRMAAGKKPVPAEIASLLRLMTKSKAAEIQQLWEKENSNSAPPPASPGRSL